MESLPKCKGFHHIAMTTKDFEKTVRFYTEGLGFKVFISRGDENAKAVMLGVGDGNYIEVFSGGKGNRPEGIWQHLAISTDNCDSALKLAKAVGAEVTMEPTNVDIQLDAGGVKPVRIAFCTGPDGEVIEFFQNR